jgi:hypothetical protein
VTVRCCLTERELARRLAASSGEPVQPARVRRWFEGDLERDIEPFVAGVKIVLLSELQQDAMRDWRVAAWLLERLRPEDYGRVGRS